MEVMKEMKNGSWIKREVKKDWFINYSLSRLILNVLLMCIWWEKP